MYLCLNLLQFLSYSPLTSPSSAATIPPRMIFIDSMIISEAIKKQECTISRLYYNASSNDDPPTEEISRIPEGCTMTQLPLKSSKSSGELFNRLTYVFTLELRVSEACSSCFHGGGQCLTDNQNKFYCKKGKSRLKLILFISISGVGLLLLLAVT